MKTNGIILAAGLSSRMKEFKPLLKLTGKTMIEHSIDSMFHADVQQVILVLGYRGIEIENWLQGKYDPNRLLFVHNPNYETTDMLTSLRIGLSILPPCQAFYLLPGDMPAIQTPTFVGLKEAMYQTNALVAFPTIDGYRKHPPLISWKCIDIINSFHGSGGLRQVWAQLEQDIITLPVGDIGCLLDADTTADYQRLVYYMEVSTEMELLNVALS